MLIKSVKINSRIKHWNVAGRRLKFRSHETKEQQHCYYGRSTPRRLAMTRVLVRPGLNAEVFSLMHKTGHTKATQQRRRFKMHLKSALTSVAHRA